MSQKRGREEGRAELLGSKRPKASSSLTEAKAIPDSSTFEVDEAGSDNDDDDDDDDYTSSSGTSSSEDGGDSDEDENEEEETQGNYSIAREKTTHNSEMQKTQDRSLESDKESITYVPGRPKPKIQRIQLPRPDDQSGLMSRLSSFLPQLQAANADLERRVANGGSLQDIILDDAKEGEEGQYIEMNLGLGVLKEKKKKTGLLDSESTTSSDSDEDGDHGEHPEDAEGGDGHVIDQLMGLGSRSQKTKPGIQEVDDG